MFLILSRAIRQQLNDFLLELSIIEMEGDCFPFCGLERTYCSGLLEQRGSAPCLSSTPRWLCSEKLDPIFAYRT